MENLVRILLCTLLITTAFTSNSQVTLPPLERVISIELNGESTKSALKKMEQKAMFTFGYRTDLVDQSNSLSRSYVDKTCREILDDIFQGSLYYKEKGNYVILKTAPKLRDQELSLEGYIVDSKSGDKVPYASIYDSITLSSAISDEYGHYQITLSKKQEIQLRVTKYGYQDTSFVWKGKGNSVLNVQISPISSSQSDTIVDSLSFFNKLRSLKMFNPNDEQKASLRNFKDKFKKKAQFSVVPGVSTNGKLGPSTSVDYSFNLLGGFVGSVHKAEIGGLFNVVWDTVEYFQLAGLFNSVGGPQRGVQVGGVANLNSSSFDGVQIGGVLNYTQNDFSGAQIAGVWNHASDSSYANQISGFGNYIDGENYGSQIAGFVNIAKRDFRGAQIAGFTNITGKNFIGTQVSGFLNVADRNFIGSQISFVNTARDMTGTQLGFVNISDTIRGVPVGFFSFSRKGYHNLELSINEVFPVNVAFKTGTNQFYNSFIGAMQFRGQSTPYWSYGYGIGSSVGLWDKSRLFFDIQSMNIQRNSEVQLNLLNKFTMSYHQQLSKNVALSIGPSFNVYLVENSSASLGLEMKEIAPYSFYEHTNPDDLNINMWVGGQLAIRFF